MELNNYRSYSIKVIRNRDNINDLKRIISGSERIFSPSNILAPSLKKYWMMSFIESYGSSRNCAVMVILKDEIPRLIMPLQEKGDKCLEFLCDETSDYNDFLYDNADIDLLKYGLEYLVSKGVHKFTFSRIPSDSITIEFLNYISKTNMWEFSINPCDTIPVVIPQPGKDIEEWKGVKPEHIRRYKRKLRALNKTAKVSFSFIETKSQLFDEFPNIKKLHIARWETIGIRSKYLDQRRESFILKVCEHSLQEYSLFFPLMKINDALAAYIIGFRGGNTIFDWNTSFSADYSKWSPGALLLLQILSNSKTYNFTKYNLMKGAEQHKFIWTDKCETNFTIEITPPKTIPINL